MAFRPEKLTLKSQEAVQAAQELASDRGHQRVEPMHLLAALLDADSGDPRPAQASSGVDPDRIARAAEEGLNALPKVSRRRDARQPRPRQGPRGGPGRGRGGWGTSTSRSSTCCSA